MGAAFDRLVNAFAWIAGALLIFQVVSVSADVGSRYFFGESIRWVIALNEWSLLFIAFLGAAWLQQRGGHVRLDILVTRFGRRTRLASELFGLLLGICVCLVLVWQGGKVTWEKFLTNEYDYFKVEEVPIFIVLAVIPLGSAVFLVQLVRDAWRLIGAPAERRSDDVQVDL
ncbi:MAG: TRAP transporter small permease [Defluviicoccus sp.]|nr:TRAP transporter small permease [Defluviicoccus sp.]MDE0384844.1 TRAP transporter small permease [Defluviicoccus sp.]